MAKAGTSGNEYDAHHSPHDDGDQLDQDEGLQDADDEEGFDSAPSEHEARLESEIGARAVSVSRQFTPQRPQRPLSFMTPQVPKANGSLSLADRVRGRISMGSVGREKLWRVSVPDPGQSTPSEGVELGQRRITDSERQVCTFFTVAKPSLLTCYFLFVFVRRLSRSEDVLLSLNPTSSLGEPFLDRDSTPWVLVHQRRKQRLALLPLPRLGVQSRRMMRKQRPLRCS